MHSPEEAHPVWLEGVIYQIYVRSFNDTNGDGVGDLPGVIEKLDYLQWLGVAGFWLTPFYPSPLLDSGYDVADFVNVHPLFGTLADFDRLVSEAHHRLLKVVIDFVPNHTSHLHPWFASSRSARDSVHRDWYIWRDPAADGGPPNNWLSEYGQAAWEWDAATGQYYLHSFLKEQPDLNWRNREVQEAMFSAMRFWFERGVDGLRIDALSWLVKDERLRNQPPNPEFQEGANPRDRLIPVFSLDQPELESVIKQLRAVSDEYTGRVLLGEIRLDLPRLPSYYRAGLHFPFNYQLTGKDWNSHAIRKIIDSTEALLGKLCWPNWFLGTHDESRVASRLGSERARMAAMLAFTLRGTGVMYYGEEIGMRDGTIPLNRIHDSYEHLLPGKGLGRDAQRTPMQWSASRHAGFTTGDPWLPVAECYATQNVSILRDDAHSVLTLYRRLIALRGHEAFRTGWYLPDVVTDQGFAFVREGGGERFLVALNFVEKPILLNSPAARGQVVLSTALDREGEQMNGSVPLSPCEGLVLELEAKPERQ